MVEGAWCSFVSEPQDLGNDDAWGPARLRPARTRQSGQSGAGRGQGAKFKTKEAKVDKMKSELDQAKERLAALARNVQSDIDWSNPQQPEV